MFNHQFQKNTALTEGKKREERKGGTGGKGREKEGGV